MTSLSMSDVRPSTNEPVPREGFIFDASVSCQLDDFGELASHLPVIWRERLGLTNPDPAARAYARHQLPKPAYVNLNGDTTEQSSGVALSTTELLTSYLDEETVEKAILIPTDFLTLGGSPLRDLAVVLASAINDWTVERWLNTDPRWLGSVLVAPQDPEAAAREIRRSGANPRMVQVVLPLSPKLSGDRSFHPIYAAAEDLGLPVAIHVGGEGAGINGLPQGVGEPASFLEFYSALPVAGQAQLANLIFEGVFDEFHELRFVFLGYGVSWLPATLWRLDREWKSLREQVPWVKYPPSDYVLQRVRFGTNPLEVADAADNFIRLLRLVEGQNLLVYSSGFPRWDADRVATVRDALPFSWWPSVFHENAENLYRLR